MLSRFLKSHWPSFIVGNLFAVGLGAASALLGVLIGPSLQLLMSGADQSAPLDFTNLFGERLAPLAQQLLSSRVHSTADFFALLPFLLLGIACFRALFGSAQWFIWERVGERISRSLRDKVVRSYLNVFPQSLIANPELDADASALVSSDIRYVREYIVRFYGGLPREGVQVAFMMFTLYLLSPKLLGIFCFGIAPVFILVSRLGKKLRRSAKAAMRDYAVLNDWLQQRLLGIEMIKHYRTESQELALMKERNGMLYKSLLRAETIKAATGPTIEMLAFVSSAFVLYIALQQVSRNDISGAVQLSFFSSLALLSQSGGKLSKYFNTNREASAALNRINDGLKRYEDASSPYDVAIQKHAKTAIHTKNLGFTYPNASKPSLSDFDFEFKGGSFYIIAGASGAGKSTLLRLLLGTIAPNKGSIVVDSAMDCKDDVIGYLPQKPTLVADSVHKNIIYPHAVGKDDRVIAALAAVDLLSTIESLEHGLETHVGFDGMTLSGGQEQRIHLARLFYHGYPIVLIDEGTSALDPVTETMTYEALRRLARNGSMVVMIAHRPNAFKFGDEILFMKDGHLKKSGALEEMLRDPDFSKTTQYADA